MRPPEHTFDEERLAALDRQGILDTPAEPGFDDIVQLAAQVCGAPVAPVSLVADDRRAWGMSSDRDLAAAMCDGEWVGRPVRLTDDGTLHAP